MKISDKNLNKEYNANSSNKSENNTDDDANINSENSTDDDANINSENSTDDDANINSENSTDDDANINSKNNVDNNSSNDSNNKPENSSTEGTPLKTDSSLSKSARKALLTGIVEIGILIAVCAIIVHFLTRSQTLSEYAEDDPTAAYGTTSFSDENTTSDIDDSTNENVNSDANDRSSTTTESVEDSNPGTNDTANMTDKANKQSKSDSNTNSIATDKTSERNNASVSNKTKENEKADTIGTSTSETVSVTASTVQYDTTQKTMSGETFTYKPGFTSSPISEAVKIRITGISYPDLTSTASTTYKSKVPSYDDLRYLTLKYKNGDDKDCIGEMICNKAIANDLLEIFSELYDNDYRIDKIRLIDDYSGNDDASVTDNNTSCFNFRTVEGKKKLSNHSLGLAVDINPLYNPYITYKKGIPSIKLPCCVPYADRTASYPYKITTDDLAYKLFIQHGFTWGGNWKSCKDYQHFEKKL